MEQNAFFSPEDDAAYQEAERKKQLAQLLLRQGLAGPAQMPQGRIASRLPIAAALAPIAQAFIGGQGQAAADSAQKAIKEKAAATYGSGVEALLNSPNRQIGITSAMTSNIPALRAMAEKFRLEDEKRVDAERQAINARVLAGGKAVGDSGDVSGALSIFGSGKLPEQYNPKTYELPSVQFQASPDGRQIPFTINKDKFNKPTLAFGPAGATTNVNLPGNQQVSEVAKAVGKDVPEVLKAARSQAQASIKILESANRIDNLLKDPSLITGFGANALTGLASLGTRLGLTGPEAAGKTQSMLAEMANATLARVKDLTGAITEKERPFLAAAAAGEIVWTPETIQRLADISRLAAHNTLVDTYEQYTGALNTPGTREAQADKLYPWPSGWNFSADPKKYRAQKSEGFSKYDYIENVPSVENKASASGNGFKPLDKMTPAEKKAEIERLRKEMGMK